MHRKKDWIELSAPGKAYSGNKTAYLTTRFCDDGDLGFSTIQKAVFFLNLL